MVKMAWKQILRLLAIKVWSLNLKGKSAAPAAEIQLGIVVMSARASGSVLLKDFLSPPHPPPSKMVQNSKLADFPKWCKTQILPILGDLIGVCPT